MIQDCAIIRAALLSGVILTLGSSSALNAATSAILDILLNNVVEAPADAVELGKLRSLENRDGSRPPSAGNPLWSVTLSTLTATQDRPIFSASRRPPPRAAAGPRIEPANVPIPAKLAEPERPTLALIGAVVGDSDAIAVFLDRTNQRIVRLRAGETHAGWLLSSVLRREVTLKRADQTEVLALQRLDGNAGPSAGPELPTPAAGRAD